MADTRFGAHDFRAVGADAAIALELRARIVMRLPRQAPPAAVPGRGDRHDEVAERGAPVQQAPEDARRLRRPGRRVLRWAKQIKQRPAVQLGGGAQGRLGEARRHVAEPERGVGFPKPIRRVLLVVAQEQADGAVLLQEPDAARRAFQQRAVQHHHAQERHGEVSQGARQQVDVERVLASAERNHRRCRAGHPESQGSRERGGHHRGGHQADQQRRDHPLLADIVPSGQHDQQHAPEDAERG